jgi:hypothetical protein
MPKKQMVDCIYLNKRDRRQETRAWAYYRVSSFGSVGDSIELCLLSFPEFRDIDDVVSPDNAVVVNPFDTGYISAYPNLLGVLKSKWNISHRDEDLIGIRLPEV